VIDVPAEGAPWSVAARRGSRQEEALCSGVGSLGF